MTANVRAVVTGIGLVTPIGDRVDAVWESLCQYRASGAPKEGSYAEQPSSDAAFVPEFDIKRFVDNPSATRHLRVPALFGAAAAAMAAESAQFRPNTCDPFRLGVFVGAPDRFYDISSLRDAVAASSNGEDLDPRKFGSIGIDFVSPTWLIDGLSNGLLHFISKRYQALGLNANLQMGGVSGSFSLGEAVAALRDRRIEMAFVCAYDSLLGPERIIRRTRRARGDGIEGPLDVVAGPPYVPSEGGACLILENYEHAKSRNATIIGEVQGYAQALNPANNATSSQSLASSLQLALDDAGISKVDAILAPGLETVEDSHGEAIAVRAVFKSDTSVTPITTLRRRTGDIGVASALVDIAIALIALTQERLPSPINVDALRSTVRLNSSSASIDLLRLSSVAVNDAIQTGGHTTTILGRVN